MSKVRTRTYVSKVSEKLYEKVYEKVCEKIMSVLQISYPNLCFESVGKIVRKIVRKSVRKNYVRFVTYDVVDKLEAVWRLFRTLMYIVLHKSHP